jgi:hypothetical protein
MSTVHLSAHQNEDVSAWCVLSCVRRELSRPGQTPVSAWCVLSCVRRELSRPGQTPQNPWSPQDAPSSGVRSPRSDRDACVHLMMRHHVAIVTVDESRLRGERRYQHVHVIDQASHRLYCVRAGYIATILTLLQVAGASLLSDREKVHVTDQRHL